MELDKLAKSVKKKDDGIYYSENKSQISYPEDGNESYLQIEALVRRVSQHLRRTMIHILLLAHPLLQSHPLIHTFAMGHY